MIQRFVATAAAVVLCSSVPQPASADAQANAALVRHAMIAVFVKHDAAAVHRYWDDDYIQHNPDYPNGSAWIGRFLAHIPPGFRYEPGISVAQGDFVMLRGRYTGIAPTPLIAADPFRLRHGKIVEHWDLFQAEVPAAKTKSGNPMFSPDEGTSR